MAEIKTNKSQTKSSYSRISIIAAIVFSLSLISIGVFIAYQKWLSENLNTEIFKLSYQFLLIVVIGGAVSLIFTEFSKTREQIRKDKEKQESSDNLIRDLQRKFYNDFIQAYNSAKKIRRLLRARARIKSDNKLIEIRRLTYDEQMQSLIDVQLKFEFFCEEVKGNPSLFPIVFEETETETLFTKLEKIEKYLNVIVDEYENCYSSFPEILLVDESMSIPIIKLKRLAEYIGKYRYAKEFKSNFKKPADEIMEGLQKLLTSEIETNSQKTINKNTENSIKNIKDSVEQEDPVFSRTSSAFYLLILTFAGFIISYFLIFEDVISVLGTIVMAVVGMWFLELAHRIRLIGRVLKSVNLHK